MTANTYYIMIKSKYEPLVKTLVANGIDLTRDVWSLSYSELGDFSDLAKKYGYKKPLQHSRGFGFYLLLQKVYEKM